MMKPTALLVLLAAASTDASQLRNRELWGKSSSSSSSSGWSFWGSLLQLLDHIHTPCPPGHLHHKDSDGKPLPPGQCWQDLHPHHHHHAHHSSSSSSSHSSSSHSSGGGHSTYNMTYNVVECQQGDAGCYQNTLCHENDANCMQYISCAEDDQDCQMWIKCDDDMEDCMANINPADYWSDDGHGGNDDAAATDDAANVQGDDDKWANDGWTSNNLDQGSSYASTEVQNGKSTPVWPFLLAALVAGCIGAAIVVTRRKRRAEMSEHPLDGAVKKRQRLFNGFNKKNGLAAEDFENEDKPNFIEISESGAGRKSLYKSPDCDDSI
ncbi:hypothetical protein ACHAWO_011919 [Cyclotella atomus]|uniref:Uncharacterized protein n=1 Tax=Cyclotella atomus TaxID=382360 RepID=A0ABD3P6Y6_9STRA